MNKVKAFDVLGLVFAQIVALGVVWQAAKLMLFVTDPSAPSPPMVALAVLALAIIVYLAGCQLPRDFIQINNEGGGHSLDADKVEAFDLMIANRIAQFLVPGVGVWWFFSPPRLYQELRRVLN